MAGTMARQNGTDWDQLLQQSEDLAVRVSATIYLCWITCPSPPPP